MSKCFICVVAGRASPGSPVSLSSEMVSPWAQFPLVFLGLVAAVALVVHARFFLSSFYANEWEEVGDKMKHGVSHRDVCLG